MRILVLAEHDHFALKPATFNVIKAAQQLGPEVHVLVAGFQCQAVADQAALIEGVQQVLVSDEENLLNFLAEPFASALLNVAPGYSHLVAPATTFGKNIMPRVAALLDVSQISDVMEILSPDTFVRPIYAGNALATVQCLDAVKVMTVRPTAFNAASLGSVSVPIKTVAHQSKARAATFKHRIDVKSLRPELTSARVIVSGGRGLQSKENFKLLEELADRLGAGLGASRAAVDAGFVPNDYQIGQTGKIVAPEVYIAIGISGAIQHLAGMKDSKIIIAINKDPDAPIFQVADYGLVGDLFQVLPQLMALLKN